MLWRYPKQSQSMLQHIPFLDVEKHNNAYGSEAIKTVGEPIQSSSTYYLFAKDNVELQQAVDGAIRELKQSGKLAEISIEVIGGDYTESE